MTGRWRGGRGFDPHQLQIDWNGGPASPPPLKAERDRPAIPPSVSSDGLILKLKWDFRTSFPEPTEQAIEAGTVTAEDLHPENIRGIHEEHAREMLATLRDLDTVLDARRRGVDPRNNKAPMLQKAKERLQKFFQTEPARLEQWYANLLGVYSDAFGDESASALDKAVRAWHAGVEVIGETKPASLPVKMAVAETDEPPHAEPKHARHHRPARIIARLPVPRPLPSAVSAGHFGQGEDGKPVRPGTREIREITEQHAEKLIDLYDAIRSGPMAGKEALQEQFDAGIAAYAEDFGQHAADQLRAYILRQASLDSGKRRSR